MNATMVNIRLEANLKKEAENLFSDLGLTMTSAINIFLRQAVREQSIPFKITRVEIPNAETLAAIQEAISIARDPKAKTYSSASELFKELDEE